MKKIALSNSPEFAIVDDDIYEKVKGKSWTLQSSGYVRTFSGKRVIYLHRLVMSAKAGQEIDHKDRNKLDCRRKNLRFATRSQQGKNRGPKKNGTSRYKGVNWDASRKKWLVRININGKDKNLGRFSDEVEAAKVYNKAAKKHYGEFACLNDV